MRLYHIVHVSDKSGAETQMTAYPMPHDKCCVMLSKQSDASKAIGRFILREVQA